MLVPPPLPRMAGPGGFSQFVRWGAASVTWLPRPTLHTRTTLSRAAPTTADPINRSARRCSAVGPGRGQKSTADVGRVGAGAGREHVRLSGTDRGLPRCRRGSEVQELILVSNPPS